MSGSIVETATGIGAGSEFPFKLRNSTWSSVALLARVKPSDIIASSEIREEIHKDIWGDMNAEHDAEHLWDFIRGSGIDFSKEFEVVLNDWRKDEFNHYLGLRQICSMVYNIPESKIDKRAHSRAPNFTPMKHLLTDEFQVCVVLAYDELISTLGYREHFNAYKQLGPKAIEQWIRFAARDESYHYRNLVDLIATRHAERIPEVRPFLDRVLEYEFAPEMKYHATFLLDHIDEAASTGFLPNCAQMVCDYFSKTSQRNAAMQGATFDALVEAREEGGGA